MMLTLATIMRSVCVDAVAASVAGKEGTRRSDGGILEHLTLAPTKQGL